MRGSSVVVDSVLHWDGQLIDSWRGRDDPIAEQGSQTGAGFKWSPRIFVRFPESVLSKVIVDVAILVPTVVGRQIRRR